MEKTAGIVVIGDEILSGKFPDQNAPLLIGELRALGVSLKRIAVVPDEVTVIADAVALFSRSFDHVFTSGGVGPTHDDVTMEGIASAFDTRVVRHPRLEELLRTFYREALKESHLRLAEIPEGAELVIGEGADWPVVCYRNVYILPGVPSLFARKFQSIRERFRVAPFVTARIYCLGDEGMIAPQLNVAVRAHPAVRFGSYPRFGEPDYRILLTLEGKDHGAVQAALSFLASDLGSSLVVKLDGPA
jgi:molybdenum cofactor synthesis domain-containing protein